MLEEIRTLQVQAARLAGEAEQGYGGFHPIAEAIYNAPSLEDLATIIGDLAHLYVNRVAEEVHHIDLGCGIDGEDKAGAMAHIVGHTTRRIIYGVLHEAGETITYEKIDLEP